MKLLLLDPRVSLQADNDHVIRSSARNGHTEVVKTLLMHPRVIPEAFFDAAIRQSSEKGHAEVVKLLLTDPRVNPEAKDNDAIKNAHESCFALLFMENRINKVFPQLFVFCSGLWAVLLPEIHRLILKSMILLRRKEFGAILSRKISS